MLDKIQENFIRSTCLALIKIKKKSKTLVTFQLLTDIYLLTGLLAELLSSFYALPFITLIILLVKGVITAVKRDTLVTYFICVIMNVITFACAIAFKIIDYNTAAAFIIAFIIYGFRIKQCVLEEKLNSLYGYPTFSPIIVINEMDKDDHLCQKVITEYKAIDDDFLLKNEIKIARMSPKVNISRISGIIFFLVGIILLCNGMVASIKIDNAGKINEISVSESGTYFLGATDTICGMSSVGMDKSAEDVYWCKFGEECVTIKVPKGYKEDFAMLYNHYAYENDIPSYSGYTEISEISDEKVEFNGIVRSTDKYDQNIINTNALQVKSDTHIIRDKYIEIVSKDTAGKKITIGIIITFIGISVYILALLLTLRHND
ncbi:MAG: hypothetical protein J6K77_04730 [Ruminococcus sp.]|nr:hypothetical protein [Ruminococcus sp.]